MKLWKDKEGKKLSTKEFFSRWKDGIEGITPQQKLKAQVSGLRLQLLGLLLGIMVSLYGYKNLWWVTIILVGATINTTIQYISIKQQIKMFENLEEMIEGGK